MKSAVCPVTEPTPNVLYVTDVKTGREQQKFPHNNFLTLVQEFRLHHCPAAAKPLHWIWQTPTYTYINSNIYITLTNSIQTNIFHEFLNVNCEAGDLQAELYQPFLPAGTVPSPGGCESCLWCGPYACAPVHCGVPVCLPAMRRVTRPSAWRQSSVGREDSRCPAIPHDRTYTNCSAAKSRFTFKPKHTVYPGSFKPTIQRATTRLNININKLTCGFQLTIIFIIYSLF